MRGALWSALLFQSPFGEGFFSLLRREIFQIYSNLSNLAMGYTVFACFYVFFFHALAFYQASRFQIDKSFSNNNFYSFYSFYPAKRFFNFIFSSLIPSLDNMSHPSPVGEGPGVRLKNRGSCHWQEPLCVSML